MKAASHSMSAIIPATDMQTDVCGINSLAPASASRCAPEQPTLFLLGDDLLTTADRRELIALFSATKAASSQANLSDRLTPSLFTCGLIRGITPMSIRERSGAPIPDFVLRLPGGGLVEQQNVACSFSPSKSRVNVVTAHQHAQEKS